MIGVLHGVSLGNFSVQLNARDQGGSALLNLLEAGEGSAAPG